MQQPVWLVVARLGRSRGRRGEVFAMPPAEPGPMIGREFKVQGVAGVDQLRVEHAWLHQGRLVLKFAGVDTIEQAGRLRDGELVIRAGDRPPPPDGEYYLADLVGCEMVELPSRRRLGIVSGWQESGDSRLLIVETPRGDLLVPFARSICFRIDLAERRIEVDLPEGLLDLNEP